MDSHFAGDLHVELRLFFHGDFRWNSEGNASLGLEEVERKKVKNLPRACGRGGQV